LSIAYTIENSSGLSAILEPVRWQDEWLHET